MDFKSKAVKFAIPFIALLMICGAIFTATGFEDSDAKNFDGISEDLPVAATIDIAPGFTYTYTLEFPADLNAGLDVTIPVNTTGVTCKLQEKDTHADGDEVWGTLTMAFPSSIAVGQYDLVIKAYHAETDQAAYQYIVFNVLKGIVFTPDLTAYAVHFVGDTVDVDIDVTTSFGNVTSVTAEGTPALDVTTSDITSGKKVTISGEITQEMADVGYYDIKLNALTDKGETASKTIRIYAADKLTADKIVFKESDLTTITDSVAAIDGQSDSLHIIVSDLTTDENRTLEITYSALPTGVAYNGDNRTFTLQSDNYIPLTEVTVTFTYTVDYTADGLSPISESVTKTFYVNNEAKDLDFDLSTGSVLTYVDNPVDKTLTATINGAYSGVRNLKVTTMDGNPITGVSIDLDPADYEMKKAIVTVTGDAAPTDSTVVKVTLETKLGKVIEKTFTLSVEDVLTIGDMRNSEGDVIIKVSTFVGSSQTVSFDITGGSSNTLTVSDAAGFTVNKSGESSVVLTGDSVHSAGEFIIKVTSAAGQEKTASFDAQVFSKIAFTGSPTAEAVFYAGE